jgi:hypothetical protein
LQSVKQLEWLNEFEWPQSIQPELFNSNALVDYAGLADILKTLSLDKDLVVTFLSKEYLAVGKLWLSHLKNLKCLNVIVIAVDSETGTFLTKQRIPFVRAKLSEQILSLQKGSIRSNYAPRIIAITSLKFLVVKFCIKYGINTILCDIDAVILQDPAKWFSPNLDISFQRVTIFPKEFVFKWGFSACSGFVRFKASPNMSAFLGLAIQAQSRVISDQLALNLALFYSQLSWDVTIGPTTDQHSLNDSFAIRADKYYFGKLAKFGLTVEALPATSFWRHSFILPDWEKIVVCHPNSPRTQEGKLKIFKSLNFEVAL